ncbi:MAG: DUF4919 domain-containing protein [Paludibacteraceae bacterium]|nr:DUF4919 domain-containing protein [Paludibacteraceae bacterium]
MRKYLLALLSAASMCAVAQESVESAVLTDSVRYVDLGLPSGIRWADCNEPGVYTFYESIEKYPGSEVPSLDEFLELETMCQWQWRDSGYTIIGPSGDSIFLPIVPIRYMTGEMEKDSAITTGRYWAANSYDESEAWGLYFSEGYISTKMTFHKSMGLPIRTIRYPERTFVKPDYEAIQKMKASEYDALLKRFVAGEMLPTESIHALYYGAPFHGNVSDGMSRETYAEINNALERQDTKTIIRICEKHLAANPLDCRGLMECGGLLEYVGADSAFVLNVNMRAMQLLNGIFVTGSGDNPCSAIHVASIRDEYFLMNVLQITPSNQYLTSTLCDMFDYTTASGRKGQMYFDIQMVLYLEQRAFSTRKPSKDEFHYNPEACNNDSKRVAGKKKE